LVFVLSVFLGGLIRPAQLEETHTRFQFSTSSETPARRSESQDHRLGSYQYDSRTGAAKLFLPQKDPRIDARRAARATAAAFVWTGYFRRRAH